MDKDQLADFTRERDRLNDLVLKYAGTGTKRFFNLDWNTYQDGALPAQKKELMGLVASLVLRCDDCILYHLTQCHKCGVAAAELEESANVALIVGGSITSPHLRRMWDAWETLQSS